MSKKVVVIGAGFSSLAAGCFLGKQGYNVSLVEKNNQVGGRAACWHHQGFNFDMGPSWFWMPDVFERFFNQFGATQSDFYDLKRLSPSYKVFYRDGVDEEIPANFEQMYALFEKYEHGAGNRLVKFLKEAAYKYEVGMKNLVYKPGSSPLELINKATMLGVLRLQVFKSFSEHISEYFSHPFLLQLLSFPVLFLGAKPSKTPALYSLMNHADIQLGTWYPMGGMSKISNAIESIALKNGVEISLNNEVTELVANGVNFSNVITTKKSYKVDAVLAGADYHFVEKHLMAANTRQYSEDYWDKLTMAPSCIIFYLGVNKKLPNLLHHNLFFDTDFDQHAKEIYDYPQFPSNPMFYVCCPSKTDPSVAPEGNENLFLLIPVAAGLQENEALKEKYFNLLINRIENRIGEKFADNIIVKRSYAYTDFVKDYNSFKGNAYGLANTLMQTAFMRPKMKSSKIKNMFYTGQLTVPGPGVPPALISGEVAAKQINKYLN
jgi:phytoene desaturase